MTYFLASYDIVDEDDAGKREGKYEYVRRKLSELDKLGKSIHAHSSLSIIESDFSADEIVEELKACLGDQLTDDDGFVVVEFDHENCDWYSINTKIDFLYLSPESNSESHHPC